jgi:protein-S-isoprenylcysteine O-methyltransferase Ste14
MGQPMSLRWRAIAAFVSLPMVMGGLLPAAIIYRTSAMPPSGFAWLGLVPVVLGLALLVECVRLFAIRGRGTLAPWDPPRELVVHGVYWWVRNPMYVALALILLGWTICFRSIAVGIYGALLVVAFHLRVVLYEEPTLRRTFGDSFERYAREVPRWLPRPPHKRQ